MTNKRVLIVGPAHPLRGGLATFDERLCRAFQEQGYDAEILSFSLQYPNFLFPGTTQYSDEAPPEGITIHTKLNSINPFNWVLTGLKFRGKFDLIVFRYWMPFMGPCLGTFARVVKTKNTRLVAITDNLIPHEKRPGDRLFTRWFVKPMHGFLTMSHSVLKQLTEFCPNKPATYNPHPMYDSFGPPLGKSEARAVLGIPDDKKVVLFFGFIRAYKGLDWFIEAVAKSKQERLLGIVAGEFYEDDKPYLELISRLNLGNRLALHTQFIPNGEVNRYFSAADLVVQPYKSATQSGVTQIAYYYGVPMVVTRTGGLAELVPDGEVGYVTPLNSDAITEAIDRFFDEDKAAEMQKNIVSFRQQFTWESLIRELSAVAAKA